ncbi:MAG: hypothetical protein WBL21_00710 [Salinimicrobium sp.]
MKKGIFGTLLLLMFLPLGCTKDMDDESSILGSWIETAPVEGRTILYFSQDQKIHLTKADAASEEFDYRIEGNTLYLFKSDTPGEKTEFFIDLLEQNRLKVENLYVSIPETEPTYIIFRRE